MTDSVRKLPTEVELAIRLQDCLAERRTYERANEAHACEFFADQGAFHSFDLRDGGPPTRPDLVQPASYAGLRRVTPEMLSGCRKAPIMAVGINPNLPGFWQGHRNALLPVFDDVLQYAHHYRYRAIGKLQIPREPYQKLRGDRPEEEPLVDEGSAIPTELANQTMYKAYQSLLDGLAEAMSWSDAKLSVGEDLSYGNMVACGSPRWITRPDPDDPTLPVMKPAQQRGIVQECFVERRHFLRQLFQSLPQVLLVFSAATRDAFIRAMKDHFIEGKPKIGEDIGELLQRKIVLRYGALPNGEDLTARVLFVPHASGNPHAFKATRQKVVDALVSEVKAKRLGLGEDGHLRRPIGGCTFCDNALYRIGQCDYREQLVPLAVNDNAVHLRAARDIDPLQERATQEALLERFVGPHGAVNTNQLIAIRGVRRPSAAPAAPPTQHVLLGRVATMNDNFDVLEDYAVYIKNGVIEALRPANAPAPAGYERVAHIKTGGTIYPGFIDLHNHVAYNVLPPWPVPKQFGDRGEWRRNRDYEQRVGLMGRLKAGDPARAVARFVEVKAMLGGVTTLQGMRSSFQSVSGAMRGLVRNVEQRGVDMPGAGSGVIDLNVKDEQAVAHFRAAAASTKAAYFYHLSEGVNPAALKFWNDLVDRSLLGPGLCGIHCLGIPTSGFAAMAQAGAALVWSPTSNLMLYGKTLPLKEMLQSGVHWSLGCDWSPSGGKNPLFEVKVARAVAQQQGVTLRARELVAAITRNAARNVRWDRAVGKIAENMRADLVVLSGHTKEAHEQLLDATEASVTLVMIDGVPRVGSDKLFDLLDVPAGPRERVDVGRRKQQLWLIEPGTPLDGFTLKQARQILDERMTTTEEPVAHRMAMSEEFDAFQLVLDDEMAPLPSAELGFVARAASVPIPQQPDKLTVLEDAPLWAALDSIEHFKQVIDPEHLRKYYG
ncbi:MAG TPA: amidohydrolase family protein [Polyangiales bacterium]|nr:amidohydrolase family protein [Polyangiales bacterium]